MKKIKYDNKTFLLPSSPPFIVIPFSVLKLHGFLVLTWPSQYVVMYYVMDEYPSGSNLPIWAGYLLFRALVVSKNFLMEETPFTV